MPTTTHFGFTIPDPSGDDNVSHLAISDPVTQIDTELYNRVQDILNPPRCRLLCATTQTIATGGAGAATAIIPSGESSDPNGMHTAGSADITIGQDGVYRLEGAVTWFGNAVGNRTTQWFKNGVAIRTALASGPPSSGDFGQIAATEYVPCVVGDKIQLRVSQSSGGNLQVNSGVAIGYINVTFAYAGA